MGFELTTLVMIGTGCIGSCKTNYYTITTTMAPDSMLHHIQHECWIFGNSMVYIWNSNLQQSSFGQVKGSCQLKYIFFYRFYHFKTGNLLFNANSAMFQPYHDENKLISWRWWWGSLCTRPARFSCIFIVLAHWNNSTGDIHVAPLGHIILIPGQPVFALSP